MLYKFDLKPVITAIFPCFSAVLSFVLRVILWFWLMP